MIIQYDTRPDATIDEKIRSLADSIMLAFNEAGLSTDNKVESKEESIATIKAQVRQLNGSVASMQSDIDGLEERWTAPEAPTIDGAYVLTVTVADGIPEYTWESE